MFVERTARTVFRDLQEMSDRPSCRPIRHTRTTTRPCTDRRLATPWDHSILPLMLDLKGPVDPKGCPAHKVSRGFRVIEVLPVNPGHRVHPVRVVFLEPRVCPDLTAHLEEMDPQVVAERRATRVHQALQVCQGFLVPKVTVGSTECQVLPENKDSQEKRAQMV